MKPACLLQLSTAHFYAISRKKKVQMFKMLKLTDGKGAHVCCKKLINVKKCFIWSYNTQILSLFHQSNFWGKKDQVLTNQQI